MLVNSDTSHGDVERGDRRLALAARRPARDGADRSRHGRPRRDRAHPGARSDARRDSPRGHRDVLGARHRRRRELVRRARAERPQCPWLGHLRRRRSHGHVHAAEPLSDTSSYTVRLGGAIFDAGANPLAQSDWTLHDGAACSARVAPRLPPPLARHRPAALQGHARPGRQHRSAARKGSIKAGATRRLRIAGGEPGPARLVVRLTDPQGNTKRLTRSLRLTA